jgi:3-hydroxyacyl-[acyl-carrier-protein] dehydratase
VRFILIDRIERLDPGVRADGYKQIAKDEDYFADHFPGNPIVPGVLVLESLAQLGGRLAEASVAFSNGRRVLPMLGKVEQAKFIRPVRPGDRLDLSVELTAISRAAARVSATAQVGGTRVATAEIMYALVDPESPVAAMTPDQAADLARWSEEVWIELWGRRP